MLVYRRTGKPPLSVTTDRIAYCAMRCAAILTALGAAKDGSGQLVEAYPDATLRTWLPVLFSQTRQSYKTRNNAHAHARREVLVEAILEAVGGGFHMTADQRVDAVQSDDCLDALVCALLARAAALGHTGLPETDQHRNLARIEGWIHLPHPRCLRELISGSILYVPGGSTARLLCRMSCRVADRLAVG